MTALLHNTKEMREERLGLGNIIAPWSNQEKKGMGERIGT
uniref:Uncharacterized protein n=1 Tax=Utricularia reniformis TaxID=192314 RepID=A0A1Y0B2J8_9LAMI|nr:hypothetical protein AEK19_MT1485 [Utricularia reniformis]ART31675.1 hypothetical protein AEK19_MT1485 [Utricularia reniformis]